MTMINITIAIISASLLGVIVGRFARFDTLTPDAHRWRMLERLRTPHHTVDSCRVTLYSNDFEGKAMIGINYTANGTPREQQFYTAATIDVALAQAIHALETDR